MPPKKRRQAQLEKSPEKAREAKRSRQESSSATVSTETATRTTVDDRGEPTGLTELLSMSDDALDTEDEKDPTFDLDSSMKEDKDHMTDAFCEEWATHLDRDDRVFLDLFLYFQLTKVLSMGETKAAEVAGMMIGKSDRTIREWRAHFFENGEIPESQQGKYQRSGVLWTSEELNKIAGDYIRSNANIKGKPNLTVSQFCYWVNANKVATWR